MYRRLSIRLLCLALFTFFTLRRSRNTRATTPPRRRSTRPINEHYLATGLRQGRAKFSRAPSNACADKCSPSGARQSPGCTSGSCAAAVRTTKRAPRRRFKRRSPRTPRPNWDVQLATPETQKTFNDLSGSGAASAAAATPAAAANEDAGDKGGLKCTPDVRELQTLRPIPLECSSDEEVASMENPLQILWIGRVEDGQDEEGRRRLPRRGGRAMPPVRPVH